MSLKSVFYGIAVIILIVILAVPFFNSEEPSDVADDTSLEGAVAPEVIACNSDSGCIGEGRIGNCVNAGTRESKCEFKSVVRTELTVINTDECFNCDTDRVVKLLKGLFPGLSVNNMGYEEDEAKQLVEDLRIEVLPAYIFDGNLEKTINFEKTKGAFEEIDGKYAMNKDASGANYYINREMIPNRLDVFFVEGEVSTLKSEKTLGEFLDLFAGDIEFFEHDQRDSLTKELEFKTFPIFLINNKIKFSGVQSADKIKENFCQLNEFEECSVELSKNII